MSNHQTEAYNEFVEENKDMNTKTKARHTAGEWALRGTYIQSNDGRAICQLNGANADAKDHARLIAAAPELLAALEKLHEEYAHQGKGYWVGTGQAVERLIKKAKGE